MNRLLENIDDIKAKDIYGQTVFHHAIEANNVTAISRLMNYLTEHDRVHDVDWLCLEGDSYGIQPLTLCFLSKADENIWRLISRHLTNRHLGQQACIESLLSMLSQLTKLESAQMLAINYITHQSETRCFVNRLFSWTADSFSTLVKFIDESSCKRTLAICKICCSFRDVICAKILFRQFKSEMEVIRETSDVIGDWLIGKIICEPGPVKEYIDLVGLALSKGVVRINEELIVSIHDELHAISYHDPKRARDRYETIMRLLDAHYSKDHGEYTFMTWCLTHQQISMPIYHEFLQQNIYFWMHSLKADVLCGGLHSFLALLSFTHFSRDLVWRIAIQGIKDAEDPETIDIFRSFMLLHSFMSGLRLKDCAAKLRNDKEVCQPVVVNTKWACFNNKMIVPFVRILDGPQGEVTCNILLQLCLRFEQFYGSDNEIVKFVSAMYIERLFEENGCTAECVSLCVGIIMECLDKRSGCEVNSVTDGIVLLLLQRHVNDFVELATFDTIIKLVESMILTYKKVKANVDKCRADREVSLESFTPETDDLYWCRSMIILLLTLRHKAKVDWQLYSVRHVTLAALGCSSNLLCHCIREGHVHCHISNGSHQISLMGRSDSPIQIRMRILYADNTVPTRLLTPTFTHHHIYKLAEYLISCGAPLDIRYINLTPLHHALLFTDGDEHQVAIRGESTEILSDFPAVEPLLHTLISSGAHLDAPNDQGMTPADVMKAWWDESYAQLCDTLLPLPLTCLCANRLVDMRLPASLVATLPNHLQTMLKLHSKPEDL